MKRPTVLPEETMISRARRIHQLVIVQCWTTTDIFVLVYVLSLSTDMNKFGTQHHAEKGAFSNLIISFK